MPWRIAPEVTPGFVSTFGAKEMHQLTPVAIPSRSPLPPDCTGASSCSFLAKYRPRLETKCIGTIWLIGLPDNRARKPVATGKSHSDGHRITRRCCCVGSRSFPTTDRGERNANRQVRCRHSTNRMLRRRRRYAPSLMYGPSRSYRESGRWQERSHPSC